MKGKHQGEFLTFPSFELLQKTMTAKRWSILKALQEGGPRGVRPLARELGFDPGNLQRDLAPLKEHGLVIDTDEGLAVPYDEIRLEIVVGKVA